ncbi:hypothetical protein [Georgenia daeguensis]|uniref:Calcineurin-like phosphoesterase domain-containing protein n=1 Tax=Georgenia daeguensis TaxID=908355 RepID=A0ABP8EWE7_9MICO
MRRHATTALLASGLLAPGLAVAPAAAAASAPGADDSATAAAQRDAFSFAVIGDVPYGAAAIEAFPGQVAQLNADESLDFVTHVGDIKNGSSECSDEYFAMIRAHFDAFTLPFVFTPGDNEWTDCHRQNNGAYDPLERLDAVREVFFPVPGKTLGATMPVDAREEIGLPENVTFHRNRVEFSVLNVQGSNNGRAPWTGLGLAEPTAEQLADVEHRTDAAVAQIEETFETAERRNSRAVVLVMQADMFDPSQLAAAQEDAATVSGFQDIVEAVAERTNAFDGEVYLVNGDSHVFNEDAPLAADSPWAEVYGVTAPALERVTVDGSAAADNYLRVSVAPNASETADVLSWERVPFEG